MKRLAIAALLAATTLSATASPSTAQFGDDCVYVQKYGYTASIVNTCPTDRVRLTSTGWTGSLGDSQVQVELLQGSGRMSEALALKDIQTGKIEYLTNASYAMPDSLFTHTFGYDDSTRYQFFYREDGSVLAVQMGDDGAAQGVQEVPYYKVDVIFGVPHLFLHNPDGNYPEIIYNGDFIYYGDKESLPYLKFPGSLCEFLPIGPESNITSFRNTMVESVYPVSEDGIKDFCKSVTDGIITDDLNY